MPRRRTVLVAAGAAALLAAGGAGVGLAVADDGPTPSRAATDRPCGRAYVEVDAAAPPAKDRRRLQEVAHVEQPTALAFLEDGSGDGLLGSRTGEVRWVEGGRVTTEVVLDLSDDTIGDGDGGLLALAYDPASPWLYAYRTTRDQDERVTAYPVSRDGRPDADREREILAVDHPPSDQHHGGGFAFGPDGFLYIGLGDGGGLGDPRENAQDPSILLGKVLRIDPTPEADRPYAIPDDNPFVDRPDWRPEIWALGLRNPFRLTFDPATGDLWVGDVGQSCWEELDRLPASPGGENLGWDIREGTHRFEGGPATGGATREPEWTYAHGDGWCAIVAGFVEADGGLLHTDYCKGRIVVAHQAAPGSVPRLQDTGLRVARPVAIVAGPGGEPWVLSLHGGVYRISG